MEESLVAIEDAKKDVSGQRAAHIDIELSRYTLVLEQRKIQSNVMEELIIDTFTTMSNLNATIRFVPMVKPSVNRKGFRQLK